MKGRAFLLGLRRLRLFPRSKVAGRHAALLQVLLVILFGTIERACRRDLRRDGPLEFAAGIERCARLLCRGFLLRRMKENRRAILCAEVWTLPVHLCRVVSLPENVEQLFVTHFCGIERNLHPFRMPRFIPANVFVGWIRHISAAVAYGSVNHSRDALKRRLNTPKAPRPKRRNLCHGCHPLDQTLGPFCAHHLDARTATCGSTAPLRRFSPRRSRPPRTGL